MRRLLLVDGDESSAEAAQSLLLAQGLQVSVVEEQAVPAGPLLAALEDLLTAPAGDARAAMARAAQLLADVRGVEKVDIWLPENDLIRAMGVSDTPLGRKQVALGLDHFTRDEQTRVWDVLDTGVPYLSGSAHKDSGVHPRVRNELGVRSMAGVPIDVAGERRGVLLFADTRPDHFTEEDLRFLRAVAHWLGLVIRQADLLEEAARRADAEAEHRTLHSLLMDAPPLMALLSGPDFVFTFVNASYRRLFPGRPLEGLPLRQALPELAGQGFFELIEGVYRTGRPVALPEVLIRLDRGDGTLSDSYFNALYAAVRDPAGEITGVMATGYEVTAQVLARQGVERLAAEQEAILAQVAEGVIVTDTDGRITFINAAAKQLHGVAELGVPVEEYASTYHLYTLEGAPHPWEELPLGRAVRHRERVEDARWRIRRPDGAEIIVEGSAAPITSADGQPLGAVVTVRDVTQRERATAERERLLAVAQAAQAQAETAVRARDLLLGSTSEGIFGIDKEGHTTFINPAALALLGYTSEECLGRNMHALAHYKRVDGTPYPVEECPVYATLQTGQPARLEREVLWHKDGHPMPALYSSAPLLQDGRVTGAVVTIVDLTERERMYEAEQEARAEAEAAVRARDQFLSIASHELRNPLAGLLVAAQLLQRRAQRGTLDPEQLAASARTLVSSADRLSRLVGDLLDVSRLRTGQMPLRLQALDLSALVREAAERAQAQATEHQIRLEVACDSCILQADPDRVQQVVDNLLDNALKYSPAGGEVAVRLEHEGDGLVLRVSDRGIGLPPGAEERIFEPFGRAPNATRENIPGMGLGLHVSRQIAEAHGGTLRAVSAGEGRGTTLTLRLPAAHQTASGA